MRAYLDGRTKKKPAILTSRALIGFPISYEAIGVDHAMKRGESNAARLHRDGGPA